ncbi:MAG: DMT family transporter [Nitrospirae bacterium]|nr:DMT family transporter [Candidatus Manganitrophaceae bacterium]
MEGNLKKIKYHFLVLLATILVAGSFLASEKLAGIINPFSLTLLRFIGATVILIPFVLFKHRWRTKIIPTMPRAMIISFFYSAFFIGLFEALNTTTSLNTSTLFTLVPFITALLSILAFRESVTKNRIFVYLLGVVGTSWVIFGGELELLFSFSLNDGDFIFLAAILFMSIYSVAMKILYRDDEMIVLVLCTLIGGSFWMALALLVSNQPLQWNLIQNNLIFHMAYLIVGATLATVYLYQVTTVALGPIQISAYIYLNPVLVAILLLLIDEKSISMSVVPGILISIVATILLQFNKKNKVTKVLEKST